MRKSDFIFIDCNITEIVDEKKWKKNEQKKTQQHSVKIPTKTKQKLNQTKNATAIYTTKQQRYFCCLSMGLARGSSRQMGESKHRAHSFGPIKVYWNS